MVTPIRTPTLRAPPDTTLHRCNSRTCRQPRLGSTVLPKDKGQHARPRRSSSRSRRRLRPSGHPSERRHRHRQPRRSNQRQRQWALQHRIAPAAQWVAGCTPGARRRQCLRRRNCTRWGICTRRRAGERGTPRLRRSRRKRRSSSDLSSRSPCRPSMDAARQTRRRDRPPLGHIGRASRRRASPSWSSMSTTSARSSWLPASSGPA